MRESKIEVVKEDLTEKVRANITVMIEPFEESEIRVISGPTDDAPVDGAVSNEEGGPDGTDRDSDVNLEEHAVVEVENGSLDEQLRYLI